MSRSKFNLIIGVSLLIAVILSSGCVPDEHGGFSCDIGQLLNKGQEIASQANNTLSQPANTPSSTTNNNGPSQPHVPARTGDITTGAKVDLMSQTIGPSGGMIAVSKLGDPLDGFVIDVPPNAYPGSSAFKVSYAPITKQTFGNDINPASPMIYVENGGAYSDEIMYVRVPVKVPVGYFAMGFLYDDQTKQLEGMPMVGRDSESVTVATMHFSDFFISIIERRLLSKDIDSGFRPGVDDWEFPNKGSYIAPSGHCEGQSLTAMWYYCTKPDGPDSHLYNRYDNNGNQPATPDLWVDDSQGYQFCSVVQNEQRTDKSFWDNIAGVDWKKVNNGWVRIAVPGVSDETEWELFAYSMKATREPQEVGIWRQGGGGHAMICYRIKDGNLYIADPNHPGITERRIEYSNGQFVPYESAANREDIDAGHSYRYDKILYCGKSTVVPWDKIAQHWTVFQAGAIGSNYFPQWKLQVVDSQGKNDLVDLFVSTDQLLAVGAWQPPNQVMTYGAYMDGAIVQAVDGKIPLKPGSNDIGFVIWGQKNVNGILKWRYIDFRYFTVIYEAEQPTAEARSGHPIVNSISGPSGPIDKANNTQYKFSINVSGGKPPYNIEWRGNKIMCSGAGCETVDIWSWDMVGVAGDGDYVFITVKDSAGENAVWLDDDGIPQYEFTYGALVHGGFMTLPRSFPYRVPSGQ